MDPLFLDLRFAWRNLTKRPGFALLAITTLALGIGATTAMFSVLHGVMLAPLPYGDPERLVRLWETRNDDLRDLVSPRNFVDWQAASATFEAMTAFTYTDRTIGGPGDAERVRAARVTPGYLAVLGLEPHLGRAFAAPDGVPDGEPIAMLGHAFWQRRYGGRQDAVGQTLTIEGTPHEIVGVAPAGFAAPFASADDPPAIFVPLRIRETWGRGGHWLRAVARLDDGQPLATAQAEMRTIAAGLEAEYPSSNAGRSVFVEPLHDAIVGGAARTIGVLVAAVGLLLLLAMSNVAHLLLERAVGRQREIAVRQALGAARRRLARQLLTESLLLTSLGAAAGLLLAIWVVESVVGLGADAIPRSSEIAVSAPALACAVGLALITAGCFGWVPLLLGRRARPFAALRDSDGGEQRRAGRLRGLLVVAEIAVAVVLLLGAGVLLKSFARLLATPSGVDAERVTVVEVALPGWRYEDEASVARFFERLLPAVREAPGVEAAGAVNNIAFLWHSCDGFVLDDRPAPAAGEEPCADNQLVTPEYFRAAGIPLVAGRDFDARDRTDTAPVIAINDTLARRFWPGEDALGKHVTYNGIRRRIVAVAADVRRHGLDRTPAPEMFIPHAQDPYDTQMLVTVRGPRDAAAIVAAAVHALDPAVPTGWSRPLDEMVARTVAAPRLRTVLLAAFAFLAVAMAVVGLYGLISFAVTARSRELGIRMALGARQGDVVGMVLRRGLGLTTVGLAIGIVVGAGLVRVLEHLLFETRALDPAVFAGVPLLFAAVSLLAAYLPAARAARLDPTVTLRYE